MNNTKEITLSTIDINQTLLKSGILHISGEIRSSKVLSTINDLLALQVLGYKEVSLYIDSQGGDIYSAFALIDIIKASPMIITTYGVGMICSSGLLIFLAGDNRIIFPNTAVLSHQYSGGYDGKYHDLKSALPEYDNAYQRMIDLYSSATGLSITEIKSKLLSPSDVWLTPKQCIKYKIAHKIMPRGKKPA